MITLLDEEKQLIKKISLFSLLPEDTVQEVFMAMNIAHSYSLLESEKPETLTIPFLGKFKIPLNSDSNITNFVISPRIKSIFNRARRGQNISEARNYMSKKLTDVTIRSISKTILEQQLEKKMKEEILGNSAS